MEMENMKVERLRRQLSVRNRCVPRENDRCCSDCVLQRSRSSLCPPQRAVKTRCGLQSAVAAIRSESRAGAL